ncbi:hypothetical protein Pmani_033485 [Petrolisthes manimaculis]|uniref:G-protein coupled receptors family 2 profile 2 domain-containing protein n=1 Tax=Petrolisthes manimaculis TaxID=1843537 RepID=A0AAE1NPB8_9EUCA|nr:hypothetical protein Pmani_033485 [Petrolisthes manimaculis]
MASGRLNENVQNRNNMRLARLMVWWFLVTLLVVWCHPSLSNTHIHISSSHPIPAVSSSHSPSPPYANRSLHTHPPVNNYTATTATTDSNLQQQHTQVENEQESFLSHYVLSILTALGWRNGTSLPYPLFDDNVIQKDYPDNNTKILTKVSNSSEQFSNGPSTNATTNINSPVASRENVNNYISTVSDINNGNAIPTTNNNDAEDMTTLSEPSTANSTPSPTTATPPSTTTRTTIISTPFTTTTSRKSITTAGGDRTPTPKPPLKFSIPRCCLDEEEGACTTPYTNINPKASLLPIANGRCGEPSPRPFKYHAVHNLSCSSSSFETSVLGDGNSFVYTNMDVYFSLNRVLTKKFCVDTNTNQKNDSSIWIVSCTPLTPPRRCPGARCLRKCCPDGYALQNRSTCTCHEGSSYLSKSIMGLGLLGSAEQLHTLHTSEYGFPSCSEDALTIHYKYNESKIHILANGSISLQNESGVITDYCLDDRLEEPGEIMALVCQDQSLLPKSPWLVVRGVLIPAGLVVSCVFLGATLLCHLCVAPLRDIHGLCLAAYVAALLVADATLFLTQALSGYFAPAPCVAVAVILHVAFLSTFFWLNVICYDVWNYVGLTVQAIPLYRRADDLRIFIVYAVYAWGCPLVIGVVAVTIHFLPKHIDWLLRPGFEQNQCWFRDGDEILAYFYGPMGVLCVVNTLLISHAGLRLYCADQRCTCLPPACCVTASHALYTTHMTEFWQRFTLFVLMVICWVMEVVSWLVGPADSELWALTDTLNAFQGVIIFTIFLRSSKKRRLLQEQLAKWSACVGGKGKGKRSAGGGGKGGGKGSATKGGKGRAKLTPPHLPEALSPERVLGCVKQSGVWECVVSWCSRWQSGPPHLTRQQIFNNITFKMKQESSQDFDNNGFEDESQEMDNEDEGRTDVKDASRHKPMSQKTDPIWTMPSWKSHWSKSYFPNVFSKGSSNADAFWTHLAPGISDCTPDTNQTDQPAHDTANLSYSSLSTSLGDDNSSASSSPAITPSDQRPTTFPGWTFVRQKSWSLGLSEVDTPGAGGDKVVCQGLTRRDTTLH